MKAVTWQGKRKVSVEEVPDLSFKNRMTLLLKLPLHAFVVLTFTFTK